MEGGRAVTGLSQTPSTCSVKTGLNAGKDPSVSRDGRPPGDQAGDGGTPSLEAKSSADAGCLLEATVTRIGSHQEIR